MGSGRFRINYFTQYDPRRLLLLILIFVPILLIYELFQERAPQPLAPSAGKSYFVDCDTGSDRNNGLAITKAWQSLRRVNRATLAPGDSLRFKRGCVWTGTLNARWQGSAEAPIVINAYGSGALPIIQNGPTDLQDQFHANVAVTGSHQIFEYLETRIVDPPVSAACKDNPIGFYVGFNFTNPQRRANGGSYNIVRYSKTTRQTIGLHLNTATHHNRVLHNLIADNHVMHVLTPPSAPDAPNAFDDIGAWGVLLKGNHNEIAFNYFTRNQAFCTFDTGPQGNSVEIYEGQHNLIRHNIAVDDRVFSEVGGSTWTKADDNQFLYNLIRSTVTDARFIVVRGNGSQFGPTYRTKVIHNTVYLTGAQSQAIVCGAGCNAEILVAKNNILWAEEKVAYADAAFLERRNIYWSSNGTPVVEFQNFVRHPSSLRTDPRFLDADAHNFALRPGSPARNSGLERWWGRDLFGTLIPQGDLPNIGAVEGESQATPAESTFDPNHFSESGPPLAQRE